MDFPDMLRKASNAVGEKKGSPPQDEASGKMWIEDLYRKLRERFDRQDKHFDKKIDEIYDELSTMRQHVTRLEHGARQPRLTMEVDGQANTRTRERTEGAATAVQSMRGDSFPAGWVEPGTKTNTTTFGVEAEPPALPCRNNVGLEGGDAAPESCLPSLEIRSSTSAGGLFPKGNISTTTETSFNLPPLRFCMTEETDSGASLKETDQRASTLYASFDSSVFQEGTLSATPYCRRVVETKSRQTATFDPGGSQDHHRARPFLGSWHALIWGEAVCAGAGVPHQFFGGSIFKTWKPPGPQAFSPVSRT